ncbi:TetR family transcriptional regulator [Parvibaculum sedimenti]|uniref:TetR family transcriptional regulator n=1 Tax=Parvibaculum sedimenti TaxID=2608632 RepID=A0A6N6VGQ9_9HYPH|nr:helix-turn-helix domain-containing protein [Parvibaculum sedimenti]KAB7740136.1 TetR family transcriptional regulator [Parvibaculum sedimenti]
MRARLRGQKTQYHHGDLRHALLEAAMTLIDIRGPEALTLRAAARRAGVSEAAPYRHFANLDALLGAVVLEGFEILITDLESVSSARSRRDTYLAFAGDFPGRYSIMFGPLADRGSAAKRHDEVAHVSELVEEAGGLALLHGMASLRLAGLS